MTQFDLDKKYLLHTLKLAQKRVGFCAPNPSVGAVVVKENNLFSEGFHEQAGAPHAEVAALMQLSLEQTQDATLYVSLEPCTHEGKTPPCTDLIIAKKIKRVVFASKDPNTQVKGNGAQLLKEHGIECVHYPLEEINQFYKAYKWYCIYQRPFVIGKIALSLNGKISDAQKKPVHITGEKFRIWVHQQRLSSDAILTTAKTIIADNPLLNVRLDNEIAKPIYVLDQKLTTPLQAKIFSTGAKLCFFYSEEFLDQEKIKILLDRGARCVPINLKNQRLDLVTLLKILGKDGCHQVWLEAGGTCFQSFVLEKLMNKAYIAVAPKWLDNDAPPAFDANIFSDYVNLSWREFDLDSVCEINYF